MKKLSFAVMLMAIGFAAFMTGCEDETDPVGPTLRLFGDGDYVDTDATVEPGSVIKFSWLATKGDVNLKSFNILVDNLNVQGFPKEDIPNDNYQDSVSLEAPANEGAYIYMFIATDRNDLADSTSLSITVEKSFDPVTTHNNVTLDVASSGGNNQNTCASIDGTTFSYNEGTADSELQEKADFVYYYSGGTATGGGSAVIAAPSDVSDVINDGFSDWSTLNETKFYDVSISSEDFDAMEDDEKILELVTGTSSSRVEDLEVGDFVGFETAAGRKGIFEVTGLVPGWGLSDGQSITITIKVQETAE